MQLSLGFSPCPNDTFLFDAMIHGKIDTEGLTFSVELADVEALNQGAFQGKLDLTKLSYHAYAYALQDYVLLNSGSALGNNCGPLLIARQSIPTAQLNGAKVAIPGQYTTANFLLSLAFPKLQQKEEKRFSEIETAVLNGEVDAGLIIHENRFTYAERGLHKLMDLGEFWEQSTQLPIPLGGIVVKRTITPAIQHKVDRVLRRSVEYALANPDQTMDYVSQHAQEMETAVMRQHIDLYVNHFTANLGAKGREAVQKLFDTAVEKGIIDTPKYSLFLD